MNARRFLGRDPASVAADIAAIRAAIGTGLDDAQALWATLDRLARNESASPFTRRRAKAAAVALGSVLDDLTAADAGTDAFTWNDPREPDR